MQSEDIADDEINTSNVGKQHSSGSLQTMIKVRDTCQETEKVSESDQKLMFNVKNSGSHAKPGERECFFTSINSRKNHSGKQAADVQQSNDFSDSLLDTSNTEGCNSLEVNSATPSVNCTVDLSKRDVSDQNQNQVYSSAHLPVDLTTVNSVRPIVEKHQYLTTLVHQSNAVTDTKRKHTPQSRRPSLIKGKTQLSKQGTPRSSFQKTVEQLQEFKKVLDKKLAKIIPEGDNHNKYEVSKSTISNVSQSSIMRHKGRRFSIPSESLGYHHQALLKTPISESGSQNQRSTKVYHNGRRYSIPALTTLSNPTTLETVNSNVCLVQNDTRSQSESPDFQPPVFLNGRRHSHSSVSHLQIPQISKTSGNAAVPKNVQYLPNDRVLSARRRASAGDVLESTNSRYPLLKDELCLISINVEQCPKAVEQNDCDGEDSEVSSLVPNESMLRKGRAGLILDKGSYSLPKSKLGMEFTAICEKDEKGVQEECNRYGDVGDEQGRLMISNNGIGERRRTDCDSSPRMLDAFPNLTPRASQNLTKRIIRSLPIDMLLKTENHHFALQDLNGCREQRQKLKELEKEKYDSSVIKYDTRFTSLMESLSVSSSDTNSKEYVRSTTGKWHAL